MIKGIFKK